MTVCLVAGAGPGIGQSVAKRFIKEGFTVIAVRRSEDKIKPFEVEMNKSGLRGKCVGLGCDVRKEEEVTNLVNKIEHSFGPISCAVHNIGANIGNTSLLDTTSRVYTKVWEMAAFSSFLLCREVGKQMVTRQQGTILITGATASVRGSSGFGAFSSAMMAKRAIAQSAAREFGPQGVHVAHVVVDGVVDNPNTRKYFSEKDKKFEELFSAKALQDALIKPDSVAELYWNLHNQDRSVWTHEVDIRPWLEKW